MAKIRQFFTNSKMASYAFSIYAIHTACLVKDCVFVTLNLTMCKCNVSLTLQRRNMDTSVGRCEDTGCIPYEMSATDT